MLFRQLFDEETWTYTYLLADKETGEAVLIDSVLEQVDRDLQFVHELNLTLKYVLDTHVHADHITGAGRIREATGAQSIVSAVSNVGCVDIGAKDKDVFTFGKYAIEVRSTPGHTNGCLTFLVTGDGEPIRAFTGDALFIRGCGRTDFQAGDAKQLYHSIHEKIFTLPDETEVWPGHDYRGRTMTTVGEEKAYNPRLGKGKSLEEFVEIMNGLDLANPKFMDVAVPANLGCGITDKSEKPFSTEAVSTLPSENGIAQVKEQDLSKLGTINMIDVREPAEYTGELGHLNGSRLVPLATLEQASSSWSKDEPYLLICRSGGRSMRGAELLKEKGFAHVMNLSGGMLAVRSDAENGGCG